MARLSSSTPHTTEMTKLVRYHAHLHACGAISATPVAKERRQGWGAGTLRRRPTQQRRRQRRGLRSAAGSPQRPARCSSGSGEAARGVSARASAPACSRQRTTPATAVAAALCVASRRGWQSLRRRGLSVRRWRRALRAASTRRRRRRRRATRRRRPPPYTHCLHGVAASFSFLSSKLNVKEVGGRQGEAGDQAVARRQSRDAASSARLHGLQGRQNQVLPRRPPMGPAERPQV